MKAMVIANRTVFLFVLIVLLCFITCKKEEEEGKNYRLISSLDYLDGTLYGSNEMVYSGEKLISILGQDSYYVGDSTRVEFEYIDDNHIVESNLNKAGNEWILTEKIEYEFMDENMVQLVLFENNGDALEPVMKINLQYQDHQLLQETWAFYYEGAWMALFKISYTYDGDKIVQSLISINNGVWEILSKEVITYLGDEIDFVIESEYAAGAYAPRYKYDFTYENKLVTRIIALEYYDGVWTDDYEYAYTYETDGNLASMSNIESGQVERTEYFYEEGKGNLTRLTYLGGSVVNQFMPMPTKASERSSSFLEMYLAKKKN